MKKPSSVSERDWGIFVSMTEQYRAGGHVALVNGLSRESIHQITKKVRGAVLASGQTVPDYSVLLDGTRVTAEVAEKFRSMEAEYPGGYEQLLRTAISEFVERNCP